MKKSLFFIIALTVGCSNLPAGNPTTELNKASQNQMTSTSTPQGAPTLTLPKPTPQDLDDQITGASGEGLSIKNESLKPNWEWGPYLWYRVSSGQTLKLNYQTNSGGPAFAHAWFYINGKGWVADGWKYNASTQGSYSGSIQIPANTLGAFFAFFAPQSGTVSAQLELGSTSSTNTNSSIPAQVQNAFNAAKQRAESKLGTSAGDIVKATTVNAYKQEFTNGIILLKEGASSAFAIHGSIWQAWKNKGNTERLGLPIADIAAGNVINGQSSEYQQYDKTGDPSLHSWSGGVYIFLNGIRTKWQLYKDRLGHPTSDEINGIQTFQNGRIEWNNGSPKVWVGNLLIEGNATGIDNTCFYYAVGNPAGSNTGYYNASSFQNYVSGLGYHLGDDMNGNGGGNTDDGDPVYSIGNGEVSAAQNYGKGWGNIVFIKHRLNGKELTSMYAHLKEISVSPGQKISARQKIGSIGRGYNNEWIAHLHLELREGFTTTAGPGYTSSKVSKGPQSQISAENYIANNKCR